MNNRETKAVEILKELVESFDPDCDLCDYANEAVETCEEVVKLFDPSWEPDND